MPKRSLFYLTTSSSWTETPLFFNKYFKEINQGETGKLVKEPPFSLGIILVNLHGLCCFLPWKGAVEKFELLLIFFFILHENMYLSRQISVLYYSKHFHTISRQFFRIIFVPRSRLLSGVTQKPSQFLFEWNGFHVTLSFARMQIALIKIRVKIWKFFCLKIIDSISVI